jgi:hypothetical protein
MHMNEKNNEISMRSCRICGIEVSEDEGFECSDCGEFTCLGCGDSDTCNLCIGDEVFLLDILDSEEEF